jgi:hypothetical protein
MIKEPEVRRVVEEKVLLSVVLRLRKLPVWVEEAVALVMLSPPLVIVEEPLLMKPPVRMLRLVTLSELPSTVAPATLRVPLALSAPATWSPAPILEEALLMKPPWSVVSPVVNSVEETVTGAAAIIVEEAKRDDLSQTGMVVEGVNICTPKFCCCTQSAAELLPQPEQLVTVRPWRTVLPATVSVPLVLTLPLFPLEASTENRPERKVVELVPIYKVSLAR